MAGKDLPKLSSLALPAFKQPSWFSLSRKTVLRDHKIQSSFYTRFTANHLPLRHPSWLLLFSAGNPYQPRATWHPMFLYRRITSSGHPTHPYPIALQVGTNGHEIQGGCQKWGKYVLVRLLSPHSVLSTVDRICKPLVRNVKIIPMA